MYGDRRPAAGRTAAADAAAADGRERLPAWVASPVPMRGTVLGLALVALEDVSDTELLLNYRCVGQWLQGCEYQGKAMLCA